MKNSKRYFQRFFLIVCSLIMLLTNSLLSQGRKKKTVMVKTDPIGAMVYFKGESSFVGIAPFKLHPNFQGRYEVTVVKKGYEKKQHMYMFRGNENGTLNMRLSPKTRMKAGLRSMVFPGWGQYYSERKKFGVLLNLAQLGCGLVLFDAARDYSKAVDDYDNAKAMYAENSHQYDLHKRYWKKVEETYQKSNETYDRLENWTYINIGLWAYNFLDAIFFFPNFDDALFQRSIPTLSLNSRQDAVVATWSYSF